MNLYKLKGGDVMLIWCCIILLVAIIKWRMASW